MLLLISANTPTAVSQSPPIVCSIFLSAVAQRLVSLSLIFLIISIINLSFFLHWTAMIPWPAAGSISLVSKVKLILLSKSKLFIPAAAKIIASNFFSSTFWILVSMFPLTLTTEIFLFIFFNWSSLLLELEPIISLLFNSSNFLILLLTRISRGSFLFI